jgi:diguanylate cyclase (GGDEF)-like protein
MRQLLFDLYRHGTAGISETEGARIRIGNLLAALGCATSVAFALWLLPLGYTAAFALDVVMAAAYLLHFPLQARGRRDFGCHLLALLFLLHVTGLTLLFGTTSGLQLYLVLGGPIALVVFSSRQHASRVVMIAASLALYIGLELAHPAAWIAVKPGWGYRLLELSTVPTIVFVLLLIHAVYLGEIRKREASLEHAAQTDALTGLPNRRHGFEHARSAFSRARRHGDAMAVLMLDLDHFKDVNDRHGHAAGDALLEAVARALAQRLRQQDMLARWGGEEFLIVVSTAAPSDAHDVAQALLERVASLGFRHEGLQLPCTASLGVALLSAQDTTLEMLLARADRALYEAKARGRNRIVVDASPIAPVATDVRRSAVDPLEQA